MPRWVRLQRLFRDDPTHFIKLVKHFFRQFFDNEFISQGSEARLTVIHALAMLALPPILYTLYLVPAYDNIWWNFPGQFPAVSLIDHCRYVTFSMVVVGFVAVLEWDALFLDHRDFAILTPLPLQATTIFTAKIAALLLFLLLFIVDIGAVPTILYPVVETMGIRGAPVSSLRFVDMVVAHAVAVFGSSAFIFLFFVAVQGILINSLSPRVFKKVSLCTQILAMVALLLLLFLLPIFSVLVPAWQRAPGPALYWLPPLWFVGLYQTLLGSGDALFHSLAEVGMMALGLVALTCAAGYTLNYKRRMQRALEAVEAHPAGSSRLAAAARWVLNRLLLRKPLERATFFYVVNTLTRSTKHRLYLATYAGVGFALATFGILEALVRAERRDLTAVLSQPHEALLAIPLIMSFFLLSGLRMVFTVPAELQANWVFQLAEDENHLDSCSGARKVMVVVTVLLFLSLFPVLAILWGWPIALADLALDLTLSLILVELLLINFRKIPFTCSYQPGKANITVLGIFYWFAFTTYAYSMATLERWLLQDGVRWIAAFVLTLIALGALVLRRKLMMVEGWGIMYEDKPAPDVQTLGLGD
jgi:hypothetical protein